MTWFVNVQKIKRPRPDKTNFNFRRIRACVAYLFSRPSCLTPPFNAVSVAVGGQQRHGRDQHWRALCGAMASANRSIWFCLRLVARRKEQKKQEKNQNLISHTSDSDVCEFVVLIFFPQVSCFQTQDAQDTQPRMLPPGPVQKRTLLPETLASSLSVHHSFFHLHQKKPKLFAKACGCQASSKSWAKTLLTS